MESGSRLNQVAQIDFTLAAGEVSETIRSAGFSAAAKVNTSSVGQVIEAKAVSDLPLNGPQLRATSDPGPGVTGVGCSLSGTIGSGTRPDDMRPGTELFSEWQPGADRTISCWTASTTISACNGSDHAASLGGSGARIQDSDKSFQAEQGRNQAPLSM
jgi:hypothetical protein